ncbi:hypothetical protein AALP_AAs49767U000200 [Arabis alpina]|uniref:Uncharacterized protein n=1 Tax=Arabis alpina TaxID=50452 RepID=A0A087FZT8_ARAAL|nr:hypothetical protein AALP_AAs49767U000200 [Arabis alpina]
MPGSTRMGENPKSASTDVVMTVDVPLTSGSKRVGDNRKSASSRDDGPMTLHDNPMARAERLIDPILDALQVTSGTNMATTSYSIPNVVMTTLMSDDDPRRLVSSGDSNAPDCLSFVIPLNDEDPELPFWNAFASSSSSSSGSQASSDEDTLDEVQHTKKAKKAKKKAKVKVRPIPLGSSLSDAKSLQRLRRKGSISEEIVLVAPSPADKVDAPPPGYMTLFENYFDQCLLWFPLPCFLMRFLAVHGICRVQINPRGIRHLLGIYVLSKECGIAISTEHLSYLTDFRVRGPSEELKHTVTNSSGMALIAGFQSKDDHFEDRFFFAETSEKTVEADCIDLVKTRWERRVKPSLPEVSKEFVTAMHTDSRKLAEIDANLEFIGLLQGSEPPDLLTEVKALRERRNLIYDAHDVFADLLASVRRVLEIPEVSAGAAEASVVVDDNVELWFDFYDVSSMILF